MSSITFPPRTTSESLNRLPNINIPTFRPAYLTSNIPTPIIPPTYQHLNQQVQRKPALYGAGQRKYNNFHKFQTGTTTTFDGYTNITGIRPSNIPPRPAPRRLPLPPPTYQFNPHYHQQQNYNNNYNNYYNDNNNNKNLPSLFDINPFHLPSQHNTRTFNHAQQYHPNQQHHHYPRPTSRSRFHVLSQLPSQSRSRSRSQYRAPPIKPRRAHQQQQQQQQQYSRPHYQQQQHTTTTTNNNNYNNYNNQNYRRPPNNYNNNRTRKGLIISDSMCSRVRTYAVQQLPNYDVELSYESGCDIIKMMNWLQTPEGQSTVGSKEFLLICLGTNDVGQYGVEVTLRRCSDLICFIRQSFPGIRAIGWLALSPRWKPTRFVSAADIGGLHRQFNEHLQILSKQLDFDFVDACLGPSDMRVEDGLHPSSTTGRWKYEGALRQWFSSRAVAHSSSFLFQGQHQHTAATPATRTTTAAPYPTILRSNNNNYNYNNPSYQQQQYHRQNNYQQQQHRNNYNNNNYNRYPQNYNSLTATSNFLSGGNFFFNNTQPFSVRTDRAVEQVANNSKTHPNFPSKTLINFYPHKLKTQEQYFRDNEPPKEIEKEKDKLYLAANIYYQQRHFEEESKKWKIYEQIASRKEHESEKDGDDILMRDVEEIPEVRPFRERYSAILNMTVIDSDSQDNENSNTEQKDESSETDNNNNSDSTNNSDIDEEDKKKRKLHDTSLSPTSKEKLTSGIENNIRKKKQKSKKKKKISVENDPRAPEGSPVLLISDSSNRQQGVKTTKNTRPDTPQDPYAKRRRLFGHGHEHQQEHVIKPQRVARQSEQLQEIEIVDLPRTPPGLIEPPIVSPRQSTPRTPVAQPRPLIDSPNPITSSVVNEIIPQHQEIIIVEPVERMEQDRIIHSPSVISKDTEINRINLFNFPIIPIECMFHFKIFHMRASAQNIAEHREFLEKKMSQQEKELEQLMKGFNQDLHQTVVQYIKNSIEPMIDSLKESNKKRLDNVILDQMREQAIRTIKSKGTKESLEIIEKSQMRFERTLELKFQLEKLDRRLNENMPPPALNIMDKLQFRSRELNKETIEQYTEQWNNILRKSKLDLTSVMRLAKTAEINKSEKEHLELIEKVPVEIRKAYKDLMHTVQMRHDRTVQKKLHFLEKKAIRTVVK
jgi:hypothetical protein